MEKHVRKWLVDVSSDLGLLYNDLAEGKSVAELLFSHCLKVKRSDLYLNDIVIHDAVILNQLSSAIERLMKHEPLQYVIGQAPFAGIDIRIGRGVLIPRPETEELVALVIKEWKNSRDSLHFFDIGTGSGCIALALKLAFPNASVTGIDRSSEALQYAKVNAESYGLDIQWINVDALQYHAQVPENDKMIVVSNPPYVAMAEKSGMAKRVLDYEPHEALFVPDDDPLRYYEIILQNFSSRAKGFYFEINPLFERSFEQLLNSKYSDFAVAFHRDMPGKTRFISMKAGDFS